ncbi:MAG: nucleotidyltransferase domain-containing protein [Myxococcota bacterium]
MTPAIDPQARHIITTVALATHAERVVLFGSRARGDARPDSDLDLLVIVPDDVDPRLAGHAGYMALGAHKLAVDLVVLRKAGGGRKRRWWASERPSPLIARQAKPPRGYRIIRGGATPEEPRG